MQQVAKKIPVVGIERGKRQTRQPCLGPNTHLRRIEPGAKPGLQIGPRVAVIPFAAADPVDSEVGKIVKIILVPAILRFMFLLVVVDQARFDLQSRRRLFQPLLCPRPMIENGTMREQQVTPILAFPGFGQHAMGQQSLDQCLMPPRPFAVAKQFG